MIDYLYNDFKGEKQMKKLNSPCHGVPAANVRASRMCFLEQWQLIPLIHIIIGQAVNMISWGCHSKSMIMSMIMFTCPSCPRAPAPA